MFQSVLQLGCAAMVPATLAAWRPGLRPGAEEAAAECGGSPHDLTSKKIIVNYHNLVLSL